MPDLLQLQSELIDYLVNKKQGVARYITDSGPIDKKTRLNIYSNAYKLRLQGVIETDHEILSHYLGDELFDLLVEGYINAYPSNQTSLRDFCSNIPVSLKTNTPFKDHPAIAELARFEHTLLFSFDANDASTSNLLDLKKYQSRIGQTLKSAFIQACNYLRVIIIALKYGKH